MTCRRCAILCATLSVVAFAAPISYGQIPRETSVYELVDPGTPATMPFPCSCVASPFTLPAFQPNLPNGSSPAAPDLGTAPALTAPLNLTRLLEDRGSLPNVAEDARSGNGNASLSIAMHLRDEHLVGGQPVIEEEAARWMYLAAEQGHVNAFMFLGYRFQHGLGVPRDDRIAAYWFHQGALRGDAISMVALGLRYATGVGVAQDFGAAVYWWQRTPGGTPLALRFLGDAHACGLGVPREPARALREYRWAAEHGDITSNIQLGHLYANGCTPPDDAAAIAAFRRAADQGYPEAQIELSELLRRGRGAEPSLIEAYFWARMAERRLNDGPLKTRAAERAKAAAALLSAEEIAAEDVMIGQMIADAKTTPR